MEQMPCTASLHVRLLAKKKYSLNFAFWILEFYARWRGALRAEQQHRCTQTSNNNSQPAEQASGSTLHLHKNNYCQARRTTTRARITPTTRSNNNNTDYRLYNQ
jgi:hypothetical protein